MLDYTSETQSDQKHMGAHQKKEKYIKDCFSSWIICTQTWLIICLAESFVRFYVLLLTFDILSITKLDVYLSTFPCLGFEHAGEEPSSQPPTLKLP